MGSAPSFWTMTIRLVVASARAISSTTIALADRVEPGAAVPLLETDAEQVLLGEQLLQVPRELARGVDLRRPRRDALLGELAHDGAQLIVLGGQAIGHAVPR